MSIDASFFLHPAGLEDPLDVEIHNDTCMYTGICSSTVQYSTVILDTKNSESLPEKNCGAKAGHCVAGWDIRVGGSVIAADCGIQSRWWRSIVVRPPVLPACLPYSALD